MRRVLTLAILLAGCESGEAPGEADIVLTGRTSWADAAAHPDAADTLRVFGTLTGTGTFVGAECAVRPDDGRFRLRVAGEARVEQDGTWTLRVRGRDARWTTWDGCPLETVEDARIESATVRGALRPDRRTCEAYAAARGTSPATCLREGTSAIVAEHRVAVDAPVGEPIEVPLVFRRLERLDGSIVEETP